VLLENDVTGGVDDEETVNHDGGGILVETEEMMR
jgi:hypothetical protein